VRSVTERRACSCGGWGWAAGLGGVFLLVQGYEWVRLVQFGLTLSSDAYGTTFYTLIGAHAAHVLGALVWVAWWRCSPPAAGSPTAGRVR